MPGIRATIERSYFWNSSDYGALLRALRDAAAGLFGAEVKFRGGYASGDEFGVRLNFDTFDAMQAQLPLDVRDFDAQFSASDWSGELAMRRRGTDALLRLSVDVLAANQSQAIATVSALEQTLQLKPLADTHGADQSNATLERDYYCGDLNAAAFIERVEAILGPLLQPYELSGDITAKSPGAPRFRYDDKRKLLAELPATIGVLQLHMSRRGAYASCDATLDYERSSGEVRLRASVRGAEIDAFLAAFAQLQSALDLELRSRVGEHVALTAIRRTGFTTKRQDVHWFHDACALVRTHYRGAYYLLGSMRTQADYSSERNWSTLDEWEQRVVAEWDQAVELSLSVSTNDARLWLHLEPKLDFIRLEPAAPTASLVQERLDMLVATLSVRLVDTEPYAHIKTERTFALTWNRAAYVDALRSALPQFLGTNPQLVANSTFVAEDDGKGSSVLANFASLEPFYERLLADRPQIGSKVVAKGPRGKIMSIEVRDNGRRLEVRSSFDVGQFGDLIRGLQEHLQLKDPAADKSRQAAELTARQQIWRLEGFWGKVTALLLGGAISVTGLIASRAVSKDSIEWVQPHGAGESQITVGAGCRIVEWKVVERRFFDDGRESVAEIGELRITERTGGKRYVIRDFRSGTELYFPPGEWDIDVFDLQRGRVGKTLVVKATNKPNAVATPTACPIAS